MFIYIQRINLFYSYVLFYAIAIEASSKQTSYVVFDYDRMTRRQCLFMLCCDNRVFRKTVSPETLINSYMETVNSKAHTLICLIICYTQYWLQYWLQYPILNWKSGSFQLYFSIELENKKFSNMFFNWILNWKIGSFQLYFSIEFDIEWENRKLSNIFSNWIWYWIGK